MIDFIISGFALIFNIYAFVIVLGIVFWLLSIFVGEKDDDLLPWEHSKDSI